MIIDIKRFLKLNLFLPIFLALILPIPIHSELNVNSYTIFENQNSRLIHKSIDAINITENSDFFIWASSGNGSPGSPFIIEGKEIDAGTMGGAFCININDTDAFFIIRFCNLTRGFNAIWFNNVANGVIENITFDACSYVFRLNNSTNIEIRDCLVEGSYGGILDNSTNILICNNTFEQPTGMGIFLEDSSDNTLVYNNISKSSGQGIFLLNSDDNNLTENTIDSSYESGIYFFEASQNLVSKCNITNNRQCGISLINGSYNTLEKNYIAKNSQYGSGLYGGIGIFGSTYNQVEENIITNNTFTGILAGDAGSPGGGYNTIDKNQILHNQCGIQMGFASHNSITNNNISYNQIGICIQRGSQHTITNNKILNNEGYGIELTNLCSDNQISENTLIGNKAPGIFEDDSSKDRNIIQNNTIENKPETSTSSTNQSPGFIGLLVILGLLSSVFLISKREKRIRNQ